MDQGLIGVPRKAVFCVSPLEMRIIYYIQVFDGILVAAIPWLKWLTVSGLYACMVALREWNRRKPL